jgi:hypothetical protein
MTRRQTRRIEVLGVGTPPLLPLRPLVDEVISVLAQSQKPSRGLIHDFRPSRPAAVRSRRTQPEDRSDRR